MKLQAVVVALATLGLGGNRFHRLVVFLVLQETDGYFGGISKLDEMCIEAGDLEEECNHRLQVCTHTIDGLDKGLVGAGWFDHLVQGLLRHDALLLFNNCTRQCFNVGECRDSTFGMFSVVDFQ